MLDVGLEVCFNCFNVVLFINPKNTKTIDTELASQLLVKSAEKCL